VPIAGSVALLRDGVTIEYSDPNTLCRTASLAAAQTRSQVTLSLRESDEPSPCSFGFVPPQPTPVPPFDPAAAIMPILPPRRAAWLRQGWPCRCTAAVW
jgi:hypothetical protein